MKDKTNSFLSSFVTWIVFSVILFYFTGIFLAIIEASFPLDAYKLDTLKIGISMLMVCVAILFPLVFKSIYQRMCLYTKKLIQSNSVMIILIFFLLGIPIIINYLFLNFQIPSASNLGNGEWLSFWGSYLGAFIGCVPAFLAIEQNKKQFRQQHEEVKLQLDESRKQFQQTVFDAQESRRCAAIPIVDLCIFPLSEFPDSDAIKRYFGIITDTTGINEVNVSTNLDESSREKIQGIFYAFQVSNLGLGPALKAKICSDNTNYFEGDVAVAQEWNFILCVTSANQKNKQFDFKIKYHDVFMNEYVRDISVSMGPDGFKTIKITSPILLRYEPHSHVDSNNK